MRTEIRKFMFLCPDCGKRIHFRIKKYSDDFSTVGMDVYGESKAVDISSTKSKITGELICGRCGIPFYFKVTKETFQFESYKARMERIKKISSQPYDDETDKIGNFFTYPQENF